MSVPDPAALGSGPVSDIAGGATGGFEFETHSMMNQYPQSIYGKCLQRTCYGGIFRDNSRIIPPPTAKKLGGHIALGLYLYPFVHMSHFPCKQILKESLELGS